MPRPFVIPITPETAAWLRGVLRMTGCVLFIASLVLASRTERLLFSWLSSEAAAGWCFGVGLSVYACGLLLQVLYERAAKQVEHDEP
jgi:hypothetical protein